MEKFLFVMSIGFERSGAATRSMQFAAMAADMGKQVEIFLIDDAIHWAQIGMADGVRSATGEHMKELLEKIISHQTPIHVCKACADKRLVSEEELVAGAIMSEGSVLVKMMVSPEYKVFTF